MRKKEKPPIIYGTTFDIVLRFDKSIKNIQVYFDENVELALEGLLQEHSVILVRTNWWSKDLTISSEDNAPVSLPEAPQSMEGSNPNQDIESKV